MPGTANAMTNRTAAAHFIIIDSLNQARFDIGNLAIGKFVGEQPFLIEPIDLLEKPVNLVLS